MVFTDGWSIAASGIRNDTLSGKSSNITFPPSHFIGLRKTDFSLSSLGKTIKHSNSLILSSVMVNKWTSMCMVKLFWSQSWWADTPRKQLAHKKRWMKRNYMSVTFPYFILLITGIFIYLVYFLVIKTVKKKCKVFSLQFRGNVSSSTRVFQDISLVSQDLCFSGQCHSAGILINTLTLKGKVN